MGSRSKHAKISLFSATALSATAMVGSGWLFSAQLNAKIAGNYSFLAWVLAALLVMAVGLCLAQVASIYPVRGATARSSALSHNSIFGMPFAFANWFGLMVTIGTEAQATTQYLAAAIKSDVLIADNVLTVYGKLFALSILVIYLFINYFGIKLLAKINNTVTVIKILSPIFTIVIFLIMRFDTSNFTLGTNSQYGVGSAITAIISAGLIYSYNGFQLAVAFASEIENPKRNIPLSIILSIVIVMFVYMLLQLSFMGSVPHSMLSGGWSSLNFHSPLINLAMLLGVNFLAMILIADSIVSPSGTGYSYLGGASRMFYAMAKEGQMPKKTIGELHPEYNLCRRSLLINFTLTAIFLWNSDSWASLMVIVTGYHLIGYMAAPISMGAIKPKTKLFGLIIFCILGLMMSTLPANDFLKMNLSISILMVIYGAIQIARRMKVTTLLVLSTPFLTYLWLIYFYQNMYYILLVSALFYALITHKEYVKLCKETQFIADDAADIAVNVNQAQSA
ncbi:APC family permease [Legionella anisa]|uniref:APC family permease n=1 Tax=Legionella anisa TaxID=28082 RepID=A0AAX0WTP6_9GAMM|nr:APC family permease [Legionella anisa]AWN74531.1 APC family permease [Legionella anisa]KTC76594.1 amino acid permease [Legionella anisa]MBN5935740.1 APC family permease [Legionella anisa]MCW8425356.1 APC family permease [Legionella anisa]MCW8449213.1 APC family permease [Legionella anisa]